MAAPDNFDPDTAIWSDQVQAPPAPPSALGAFGRAAGGAVVPTAVGLAAFPAGAAIGAPLGPVGSLAGGLIASGIAGYGAAYGQQKALDAFPDAAKALGQDPDTREADEAAHPIAFFAGGLAPQLAAFRPSLAGFTTAKGLGNSALNAVIGGATELGQQLAGDDPVDLTKVGLSAGAGALGNKETFIGRSLTHIGGGVHAALPNDGTEDVGAAGGAGAQPVNSDSEAFNPGAPDPSGQLDLFNQPPQPAAPAAPQQGTLDLQGGQGTAPSALPPPPGAPQQGELFQPQQGQLDLSPPLPQQPQPSLDLQGGSAQGPGASASLQDSQPPPTPIGGQPGQPQPRSPGQGDLLPAPMFSPMEVLRQLRDAAGTPEKPATPDSFMLKLANGISQNLDPGADPDHKGIDKYLDDQMSHLVAQDDFLKDKVQEAQTSRKPIPAGMTPEDAQAAAMKPLDKARTQVEAQIATLSAAQDIVPDIKSQATQRFTAQAAQRVAPTVSDALKAAQARIASGDTGGARIGQPEPSAEGTVMQMAARNDADDAAAHADAARQVDQDTQAATRYTDGTVMSAEAQKVMQLRDGILNRVLGDPATLDPVNRFKAELRKAGVRDVAVMPDEAAKIKKFQDLKSNATPDQIPSSPNEMDPGLVKAAKPPKAAAAPPADSSSNLSPDKFRLEPPPGQRDQAALDAASAKRARQAAARGEVPVPPTRRSDDVLPDPNAKQGKLFTQRGQPTKAADQAPPPSKPDVMVGEAQKVLADFKAGKPTPVELPATKGEPRRDVTSLREVVHEATRQGLIDRGTNLKLAFELAKPNPNLDMVRATVAKAAKRGEAIDRTAAPKPAADSQAEIDAFMKRREAEDPQALKQDLAHAQSRDEPVNPELQSDQDKADQDAAAKAADELLDTGDPEPPIERAAPEPPAAGGMSKMDVHRAVLAHTNQWTGRPRIQTHEDASKLPAHLQGRVSAGAAGVYDPSTKTVHLLANNHSSPAEVHATLFHEALGHYGLRQLFGSRLDKVLGDIYRTNPKMRELADQWIASAKKESPGQYDAMSPDALTKRAVEEVFAQKSEAGPVAPPSVISRISSFVRDFARRLKIPLSYTQDEISHILAKAHDTVTKGAPPPPAVPRETTAKPPVTDTTQSPPLERNTAIGGSPDERAKSMMSPDFMKRTAEDNWTDIGGKARRAALNFQDAGWIADSYKKEFTVDGVPLLRNHQELQTLQESEKATRVQTASVAHDLMLKLPEKEMTAVADLAFAGRKNSVDVRRKLGAKETPGAVEQGLRQTYEGLNPKQKQVFDAVREQYDSQLADTRDLFKSYIDDIGVTAEEKAKAQADIDKDFKAAPGYVPFSRFGDFTVIGKSKEFIAAHAEHERLTQVLSTIEPEKKDQLTRATASAAKKLAALKDEHYSATTFEKESLANRHAAELKAQGWEVSHKLKADYDPSVDGVSSSYMKAITDHLNAQMELNPDQVEGLSGIKRMLNQMYLEHMPETSIMKRQLQAKGVEGYSKDLPRVYAQSTIQHAGFYTSAKYGIKVRENLEKMRKAALDQPGIKAQEVYKQVKKNFDDNQKYSKTLITTFMNNASYAYYLGCSASFGIMHTMQTPLVTLPMMAARFGYGKAAAALLSASKDVLGNYRQKLYHPGSEHMAGDTPDQQLAIKMAVAHNLISSTETGQFMNAQLATPGALTKVGRTIMSISTFMPHHIERANRLLTMKAAYKLAIADPKVLAGAVDPKSEHYVSDEDHKNFLATHPDLGEKEFIAATKDNPGQAAQKAMTKPQLAAARVAEGITADSHVDYGKTNSSGFLNSVKRMPVIGWAAQFQTYQFGMLKLLGQNASKAFDSSLPKAERAIAARTLAGVLGTHALMTGAMGLPGAGLMFLASNLYHKFLGNEDTPFDAETSFRNTLAQALGKDAGGVAARGILYSPGVKNVLPADITDRLGMGDLGNFFNQTRVGDKITADTMMSYIGSEVTGPVGAMLGNMANMYQFEHEGQYERALEELAPKAFRDVLKTQRFASAGVTTGTGMPVVKPNELSSTDLAAQLFGFTPQKVAEAYAQRSAVTEAKAQLQDRRSELIKKYTRAFMAGDSAKVQDIRNDIQAYNNTQSQAGLVTQRLSYSTLAKGIQEQRMAALRLKGGVSVSPRDRMLRNEFGNYADTDSN
jgi:hypothetical protein